MSELDFHPTSTFVIWANAFSPAELDLIEAYGDRLTADQATVGSDAAEGMRVRGDIRVTQTAWMDAAAESKWIYDRIQGVARALNDRVYQFDISGFSEHLQYSVYHGTEGGHYDWHVDHGPLRTRRKLSISVQLSSGEDYDGGDLELLYGNSPTQLDRTRGAFIIFPSFMLHRVTPVTRGTRWSLVAWIHGKRWR